MKSRRSSQLRSAPSDFGSGQTQSPARNFRSPSNSDVLQRLASQETSNQNARSMVPRTADGAERWMNSVGSREEPHLKAELDAQEILSIINDESFGKERLDGMSERISALPTSQQERVFPIYYRYRAKYVGFRNQQDNEIRPQSTCNVTSLAMNFEEQGVRIPGLSEGQQVEDRLSEIIRDDLGYSLEATNHPGSFFEVRKKLASLLGANMRQEWIAGKGTKGCRSYFTQTVLPLLEAGASASIGIRFDNRKGKSRRHIVRLEWVDDSGITIDDHYGKMTFFGNAVTGWNGADMNSDQIEDEHNEAGRAGENGHWTFEEAAQVVSYIQWNTATETVADQLLGSRLD